MTTREDFLAAVRETVSKLNDPMYNTIGLLNLQAWLGERVPSLLQIMDEQTARIASLEDAQKIRVKALRDTNVRVKELEAALAAAQCAHDSAILRELKRQSETGRGPLTMVPTGTLDLLIEEACEEQTTGLNKRIAELEAGLRDKDWSLAETLCVVLSHEGHIAALEDINSDLVDALDAVMQKYSNVPLVPWDETALTEEEWIEETSADRKAIAALAKTREKVMG
jgi:hypothetical protein